VPGFVTMGRMSDAAFTDWRKASLSFANGNCVEAASAPGVVGVRDTRLERSPVLVFGSEGWERFTAAVKSGTVAH
jgi:Domain of unknown function (DUF397)